MHKIERWVNGFHGRPNLMNQEKKLALFFPKTFKNDENKDVKEEDLEQVKSELSDEELDALAGGHW